MFYFVSEGFLPRKFCLKSFNKVSFKSVFIFRQSSDFCCAAKVWKLFLGVRNIPVIILSGRAQLLRYSPTMALPPPRCSVFLLFWRETLPKKQHFVFRIVSKKFVGVLLLKLYMDPCVRDQELWGLKNLTCSVEVLFEFSEGFLCFRVFFVVSWSPRSSFTLMISKRRCAIKWSYDLLCLFFK